MKYTESEACFISNLLSFEVILPPSYFTTFDTKKELQRLENVLCWWVKTLLKIY